MKLGRKFLLLAITAVSIGLIHGFILLGDLPSAWRNLGVPALAPTFADMRSITHSIQCKELGYNPYITSKCDPWGRFYNYPQIWLELGRFSIGPAETNYAGLFVAILFIASLFTINDLRGLVSSSIMAVASISPPVLLGIERGNTDLIIFSLVCFLFYFSDPVRRSYSYIVSAGAIFLTVLKLYPVAICAALISTCRRDIYIAVFVGLIALASLLLSSGDQFVTLLANQIESTWRSFGSPVLPLRVVHKGYVLRLTDLPNDAVLRGVSTASVVCLGFFGLHLSRRYNLSTHLLPALDGNSAINRVGSACSLIFLFTFLLQTNFDYRLVFLLPFILVSLKQFERSLNYRKIWIPVVITLYLWLAPLGNWMVDLVSLLVFTIVFSAVGAYYWEVLIEQCNHHKSRRAPQASESPN